MGQGPVGPDEMPVFSVREHERVEKQEEGGLCACQCIVAIVSGTSTCTSQHSPQPVQPAREGIVPKGQPAPRSAWRQCVTVGLPKGRGWQRGSARGPAPSSWRCLLCECCSGRVGLQRLLRWGEASGGEQGASRVKVEEGKACLW